MNNLFRFLHVLRDQAGGGEGGGGTGGSVLTNLAGGGSNNAPAGGTGTINTPGAQNTPPGNGNQGGSPPGNTPQDWRAALPVEFRDDPSLKVIHDVAGLAKSYISSQKMVGADKIVVPGKHATEDDWNNVYSKLGLPKELKDYEIKMKDGSGVDKDFVEKFKEASHKAGVLPQQAQKLADWFNEVNAKSATEVAAQLKQARTEKLAAFEKEMGNAYKAKLESAAKVLREFGDEELFKTLDETGLGDDPRIIKLLAGMQEKYMKEDSGDKGGSNGLNPTMTPAEATKSYNSILADFSHPYYKADHPNHKAAVAEVAGLFAQAHPTIKK